MVVALRSHTFTIVGVPIAQAAVSIIWILLWGASISFLVSQAGHGRVWQGQGMGRGAARVNRQAAAHSDDDSSKYSPLQRFLASDWFTIKWFIPA